MRHMTIGVAIAAMFMLAFVSACDSSITLRVGTEEDGDAEMYFEMDMDPADLPQYDSDSEPLSEDGDMDTETLYCEQDISYNEACPGGTPGDGQNYLLCQDGWLMLCNTVASADPCAPGWLAEHDRLYECQYGCLEENAGQAHCAVEATDGDIDDEAANCEQEVTYEEYCLGGQIGDGRNYLYCQEGWLIMCSSYAVDDPCASGWRTRITHIYSCDYGCFMPEVGQAYCLPEVTDGDMDIEPEPEDADETGDVETDDEIEPESEPEPCAIEGFVRIADQMNHEGTLLLLSGDDYNASAISAANGYFRFDELECGAYMLNYEHDYTLSEDNYIEIEFESPGSVYEADLWLTPAGNLSGTVSMDGVPLEGATIYVHGTEISVLSDENGSYTTPLIPAGFYDVSAVYPGCQGAAQSDIEVEFAFTATVDFDLEPYDPDGKGSVEGIVDVFNLDDDSGTNVSLIGPQNFSVSTDVSGRYEFNDVPSGGYMLRLERSTYRSIDVTGIIVMPDSSFVVPEKTMQYGIKRAALNGRGRIFQAPNMDMLLYADYNENNVGDVYNLAVTNGAPVRLARGAYIDSYVNYTPSSDGLIFKRNFDPMETTFDLYWIPLSGRGGERLIDVDIRGHYTYDFSDGLIYFKKSPSGGEEDYDLYRYDFALETASLAAAGVYRNLYLESDGVHYLVLRNYDSLSRSADIWRVDLAALEEELIIENVYSYNFAYAHNSALLAVTRLTDVEHNLADLLTVDIETLEVNLLTHNIAPDYIEFGQDDAEVLIFANLDSQKQRGDLLAVDMEGASETVAADIYRYQFYWQENYNTLTYFSYEEEKRGFGLQRLTRSSGVTLEIDDDVYPGYLYDMEYYGIMLYFRNYDSGTHSGDLYRYWYSDGHSELFVSGVNGDFLRFAQADDDNWLYYFTYYDATLQSGDLYRSTFTGSENELVDDGVHYSYSFLPDTSLLYLVDYGVSMDNLGNLAYKKAGGDVIDILATDVAGGSYTRAYWYDEIYLLQENRCYEVPLDGSDNLAIYDRSGDRFESTRFVQSAPERELFIVVDEPGEPAYMQPGIWEIRPPHQARSVIEVK